jgi:Leucine-rich repeat (LRR) protein
MNGLDLDKNAQFYKLNLTNNPIRYIKEEPFKLARLEELYISNHIFINNKNEPISNLTVYYTRDSNLNTISANYFKRIEKIVFLYLAHNQIRDIEINTFLNLNNLSFLYLNDNFLKRIKRGYFTGCKNLIILVLTKNIISFIEDGSFVELTKLSILNLNDNKLISVDAIYIPDLKNLRYLDLRNNFIKSIIPERNEGKLYLKDINLNNNFLATIDQNIPLDMQSFNSLSFFSEFGRHFRKRDKSKFIRSILCEMILTVESTFLIIDSSKVLYGLITRFLPIS